MEVAKVLLFRSTLATIASLVYEARDAEQTRSTIVDHLAGTSTKGKQKVMEDIERLKTLEDIHRQTEAALSKYERLARKAKAL